MKKSLPHFWSGFKSLSFVVAVLIGLSLHLYTQHIINELRNEARSLVLFYAKMYAKVAETENSSDLSFIFDEIILKTHFPLIYTDSQKKPLEWKGISISPTDHSEKTLKKVQRILNKMSRSIKPVPITYKNMTLGYLYYGDSRLIQQLQWLPYAEIGIIGLFILIGFIGYANIKRSEQRYIWVGMAKETAHQLGTPISSLMGWVEIMQSKKKINKKQISAEMAKDLQRLQLVTQRFSQIGSKPDLKKTDISKVLQEVVEYIKTRAPQMGRKVIISENFHKVPLVPLNTALFQWAVENIMKNSLDAMNKEKGLMEIQLGFEEKEKQIFVEIKDNGKGMDPSKRKRVFKPGYSTKKRGWGLGLTLAKRIVEEYHDGKLYIKESKHGVGTTVRIELKT